MDLLKNYKKSMSRHSFSIILILNVLLFFILPSFIIPSINAQVTSDYDYNFSESFGFESETPFLPNRTFNYINKWNYTEIYNATFSFENDTIGSDPYNWTITETAGTINVIAFKYNHSKVLEFYDSGAGIVRGTNEYSNQVYGTFEFWILTTDATKGSNFYLRSDSTIVLGFRIDNDKAQYYDGVWNDVSPTYTILDNTWYHIRIDFDCSNSGYLGIPSQDKWILRINGKNTGVKDFANPFDYVNENDYFTANTDSNYYFYIDALGYVWNAYYDYSDNVVPLTNQFSEYQIRAFEFAFDENGVPYETGDDNPCGWTDVEVGTSESEVVPDANYSQWWEGLDVMDFWYQASLTTSDYPSGMKKDDFDISAGRINITIDVRHTDFNGVDDYIYFQFYSYDSTLVMRLRLLYNGSYVLVSYYDGSFYQNLFNFDADIDVKQFSFDIETFVKLYYTDNKTSEVHCFPLISDKEGLSEIQIYGYSITSSIIYALDYVEVYCNGTSYTEDWFINEFYIHENMRNYTFNTNWYNLMNFTAIGNFSLNFYRGIYGSGMENLRPYQEFNNTYFWNLCDKGWNYVNGSMLILSNTTDAYSINHLRLSGVKLTNNYTSVDTYPTYTYQNVNINENYFYVDNLNRLTYSLFINDSNNEYIQISFNIPDISSTNRSSRLSHRKNRNEPYHQFRLYFTDTSYYYSFASTTLQTENTILSQDKMISHFTFLATDNDELDGNITLTGVWYNVGLIYFPNIDITISILTFLGILPSLLFIIVVPIIIASRSKLKFLFLPLVMFMSIIGFATDVIPLWLTVIVNMVCIMYYFLKSKYGD